MFITTRPAEDIVAKDAQGRRICSGLHPAENSLLLLVARLLWAFNIFRASDAAGNVLPLSADPLKDYENSSLISPKVFPVAFQLRSEKRGSVIRDFSSRRYTNMEGTESRHL